MSAMIHSSLLLSPFRIEWKGDSIRSRKTTCGNICIFTPETNLVILRACSLPCSCQNLHCSPGRRYIPYVTYFYTGCLILTCKYCKRRKIFFATRLLRIICATFGKTIHPSTSIHTDNIQGVIQPHHPNLLSTINRIKKFTNETYSVSIKPK